MRKIRKPGNNNNIIIIAMYAIWITIVLFHRNGIAKNRNYLNYSGFSFYVFVINIFARLNVSFGFHTP